MMETEMTAMDGNRHLPTINGDYEATANGLTIKFDNVQLAPPQGVMAVNYSWYDYLPCFFVITQNYVSGLSTGRCNPTNGQYHSTLYERGLPAQVDHSTSPNMEFGYCRQ